MKKILVSLSLFLASITYSQNSFTDNYPLQTGNIFFIKKTSSSFGHPTITTYYRNEITRDIIINDKKYYIIGTSPGNNISLTRLDTLTGVLLTYDPFNSCPYYNYEKPIDSLWASLGETPTGCGYTQLACTDTSSQNLFGSLVPTKNFYRYQSIGNGNIQTTRRYAKGFGNIYWGFSSVGGGGAGVENINLIGCIINGVIYGDTNITSISQYEELIPIDYSLSQNYPNPFNPTTKIKFDIPKGTLVKLKVYDMLGREVAELVNEKLNAGVYEYEWNGVGLPSGVYFYRLEAESFIETKRMVLLK